MSARGNPMDAFASLIADSLTVQQPQRSSADVARAVAQSMQQIQSRVLRTQEHHKQEARVVAAEQQRGQQRRRRPQWIMDATANEIDCRVWQEQDLQQLSKLLQAEELCNCDVAAAAADNHRRKRHKNAAASLVDDCAVAPTCCCFARLLRVSKAMHRSLSDIEHRLHAPLSSSSSSSLSPWSPLPADPTPAARSALPPSSSTSSTTSADTIAARWSSHCSLGDDTSSLYAGSSHMDWILGIGSSYAESTTAAASVNNHSQQPEWTPQRTQKLVELVREQRGKLLQRRKEERIAQRAAMAVDDSENEQEEEEEKSASDLSSDDHDVVLDLTPFDWAAVAHALHPPPLLNDLISGRSGDSSLQSSHFLLHPSAVRSRYFAAVDRGGIAVPANAAAGEEGSGGGGGAIHPPFYFPAKRRYERGAFFKEEDTPEEFQHLQQLYQQRDRGQRRGRSDDDEEEEEGDEEEQQQQEEEEEVQSEDELAALERQHAAEEEEKEPAAGASSSSRSRRTSASNAPSHDEVLRMVRRMSKRYRA